MFILFFMLFLYQLRIKMSKYSLRPKAFILLEDGTVFFGKSVGINGTATGEVCFNTGMTGYQEIFTDPHILVNLWLPPMRTLVIMV